MGCAHAIVVKWAITIPVSALTAGQHFIRGDEGASAENGALVAVNAGLVRKLAVVGPVTANDAIYIRR